MSRNLEMSVTQERRLCTVDGEYGAFHVWEQYSEPIPPSPMLGGHPEGTFSRVYGIVEFAEGIRRVDPTEIRFCGEEHAFLFLMKEKAWEETFKKVEEALGFQLYDWQKDYILAEKEDAVQLPTDRRNGKTTASALRTLLRDISKKPVNAFDWNNPTREQLRNIWEKLHAAGIPMRRVFWTRDDYREHRREVFYDEHF